MDRLPTSSILGSLVIGAAGFLVGYAVQTYSEKKQSSHTFCLKQSERNEQAAKWFYKEYWDFHEIPSKSKEADPNQLLYFAHALLTAAYGDGDLSPEERDWIIGYYILKGCTDEELEAIKNFELPKHANVEEEIKRLMSIGTIKYAKRVLIYDCIKACSADGDYHPQEKQLVHKVARGLDLPESLVEEIEAFILKENNLREEKVRLLLPLGHPCLPEKYKNLK